MKFRTTFLLLVISSGLPTSPLHSEDQLKDLKKNLAKAVKSEDNTQILTLCKEIAKLGGDEAAKLLFETGLKIDVPEVFKGIARELAQMTDDKALGYFEKISSSTDQIESVLRSQIYLSDVLAQMKHPKAGELLGKLVEKNNDHLRLSSIQALVQLRRRESIEPLLKLLEHFDKKKDRGLIYQETLDGLFELTGEQFEVLQDWMNWWDGHKSTFEPGKEETGKTGRVRNKSKNEKPPEFAGKEIFSKDALFVIDTSGTMRYVMKFDIPGLGHGDGSDGGGSSGGGQMTPEDQKLAKFWMRIEMAKRELLKALNAFDSRSRMNVLEFNKGVKELSKTPVPATPQNRKKATDWVKRMNFSQIIGTNTLKALERAFNEPGVTAIYFLSDGLPSADGKKNDDPLPLLDKVEAFNRFKKIKVHTFGYDPLQPNGVDNPELARANEFLKKLAQRTGGTFTILKVTDEKPPPDYKLKS